MILIKHADVFDGKHRELQKDKNLVVSDQLVTDIFDGEVSEEGFEQVIDAKGKTAIPGLTDAHVHFGHTFIPGAELDYDIVVSATVAKKLLYQGFTTVRDAGGVTGGIKKAIDHGVIEGPRIYPSNAHISQTCGHGDSAKAHALRELQYKIPATGVLADGRDEVIRAVREQLFLGASQIKLMAGGGCASECDPVQTIQFTEDEMRAAVEVAADYGTYVMAHLYTAESMKRAAKAGIKSFEHAHLLDEEVAKMAADQGIFITPMPQFSQKECELSHIGDLGRHREEWEAPKKDKSKDLREALPRATELIKKYNLKVLFGTDLMITWPFYDPRDSYDLTQYKKRFGSFEGLLAATGNVNDLIKLTTYQNPYPDGEIGVLKVGSYADLLLVDGNPVEDLDILADSNHLQLIMKDGKIYKNTL